MIKPRRVIMILQALTRLTEAVKLSVKYYSVGIAKK